MKTRRSGIAAVVATLALSFSVTAEAEMMRAFWAGSVVDAVSGNAYELAIGSKLLAEMDFDTEWMESFSGFAPADSLMVEASFFSHSSSALITDQSGFNTPIFTGQIRFLESMVWEAIDAGEIIATGTWSLDSIKFAQPRVIPIPAALPLMLGALGLLTGFRRRS